MRFLLVVIALLALIGAGLAWRKPHRAAADSPAPPPVAVATARDAAAAPPPDDGTEPDEASLRRIVVAQYEELERQGGLPLTSTATGNSVVVHPKVWEAHKDECHRVPSQPGVWECGMSLMMTLRQGDDQPLPKGERMYVKRGPDGRWIGA